MKKKLIPFALSLLMLCSCGAGSDISENKPTDSSGTSESQGGPSSYRPNIYEQLSTAFEDLNQSMTLTGRISHGTSDGTNNTETYSDVTIEISSDAYYYLEEDQTTHETLVEENCYADDNGKLINRTLDPMSNEVVEKETDEYFDIAMESPFPELEVKKIDAIRSQPNWYVIKSGYRTLSSQIVYYLTGYQTTGLPDYKPSYNYTDTDYTPTVTEFALHYNGDEIDQFRFILEVEISEDDGSYYYEGMLFELDITELGETEPRSMQPLAHTEGHDRLSAALAPYSYNNENAKNYTMHVDVGYDTNQLTGYSYDYYIDFDSGMIFNTYQFTGYIAPKNDDEEYEEYKYNFCYKFEDGQLYIYRYLADDTHAFIKKESFRSYWGFSDQEMGTTFFDGAPMIGALAPECFKDNGDDTFTPFSIYQSLALRSLLTFEEYVNEPISGDFKVVLNKDGTLKCFQNEQTGNFAIGTSSSVYATRTYTVTLTGLGSTTIPSYCVEK